MMKLKNKYPELIPNRKDGLYCSCMLSKSTEKSGKQRQNRATRSFQIIHSDHSGKFSIESVVDQSDHQDSELDQY